jgi:iron complex transport system permease protein
MPGYQRLVVVLAACVVITALVGTWYLMKGEPSIGFGELLTTLRHAPDSSDTGGYLLRELRLPRLLLSLAAGGALGIAGVLLQYTLRNPIADPGLLGISQAAGWVVALSVMFPAAISGGMVPALCLVAGVLASGILVLLARSIRDPVRLILIGVVISLLFDTLSSATLILLPFNRLSGLSQYFSFTVGSLSAATWSDLSTVLPWLAVAVPIGLLSGRALNLLQLGDDIAIAQGMRVTRARAVLLGAATLLVAPVVAVVGPVSFVSLVAPHVAKWLLRTSNAYLVLPASAGIGAVVLLLADAAGRLLFFPREIPAGIWTIVVIGPVAVWMARQSIRQTTAAAGATS